MAFTLLDRLKRKITGTTQAVGNVINQSIPGGISGGVQRVAQGFQNPQQYNVFSQLPQLSRQLQQFPDTTIQAPKLPSRAFDQAPGGSSWFNQAVPFATSLPGEILRSYGRTAERVSTPAGRRELASGVGTLLTEKPSLQTLQNPAVQTALDLTDFLPGGLFFAGGVKALGREAAEKTAREATEKTVRGSTKKATRRTTDLFGGKSLAGLSSEAGLSPRAGLPSGKLPTSPTLLPEGTYFVKNADEARSLIRKLTKEGRLENARIEVQPKVLRPGLKPITEQPGERIIARNTDELRRLQKKYPNASISLQPSKETIQGLPPFEGSRARQPTKDIGWFQKLTIPDRVNRLRKTLPEQTFRELDTLVITPLSKHLSDSVDWGRKYINTLTEMKVAPGSEQSKLIQQFGEGKLSRSKLVSQVGEQQAKVIEDQAKIFRNMYDDILQFVNTRRRAANLPEIPKRKDYFRHMGEFSDVSDILESFTTGKGTREFSSSIFRRQRPGGVDDAVGNFMNYLQYAQRAGFSDLVAPDLEKIIQTFNKTGVDKSVVKQLEGMLQDVLGTAPKSTVARAVETITRPLRTAKVSGNPGSILAQAFNIPQAIAITNPVNFVKSFRNTEATLAVSKSPFIKSISEKIPTFLVKGKLAKATNIGGGFLQDTNLATAKTLWKAFYTQAKNSGQTAEQAAKYAEDMMPLLMGERRIGMRSSFYASPFGKIMSPFTLENQASITRLIDSVGQKRAGEVLGTLFAWNIANTLNEQYGSGFRPFFDPIRATQEMLEYWQGSEEKEKSPAKAIGRVVGELTNLIPAIQTSIFTAYKIGESAGLPESRQIFGTDDPTWQNIASIYWPFGKQGVTGRYVTGVKAIDYPLNLASAVIPFLNPALRGVQATGSLARGYTKSRSGRAMYETPTDPLNMTRAVLFGQSSTPQAREYFENEFNRPLTKEQQQKMETMSPEAARSYLAKVQQQNIAKNKLVSYKKTSESVWSRLFGGGKVPDDQTIKDEVFGGYDIKSASSATEKKKIYNSLLKTLTDETLPDEFKEKALVVSGVNPVDVGYYQAASMEEADRIASLQGLLNDQTIERDELLTILAFNKRIVAGKSMLGTSIFEYLYDQGLLSKDEKKLLNAVRFDEVNGKFYLDRDYKPASSGLTASQQKTLINKINSIYKTNIKKPSAPKTITTAPRLTKTQTVVKPSKAATSRQTQDVWFNRY